MNAWQQLIGIYSGWPFEMTTQPDIPHEVSINEAVELAKKYSTDKAASFINGILDSISKELKQ